MTDKITKKQRSKNMASVKSKNTDIELIVRKKLFLKGFRYRLHCDLPGKPDIALKKYKTAIFVHGCFWHQHNCKKAALPASNIKFWKDKLKTNLLRDTNNTRKLKDLGWNVEIFWECEINSRKIFFKKMKCLLEKLQYNQNNE